MNRNARRNPRLALATAMELRRAGRLDEAEALLRQTLAREPRNADVLHFLGLLRNERGDATEAIALVARAVQAAPDNVDAARNLGNLCMAGGDLARAEGAFRLVLQKKPADVAARGNLATVLDDAGRHDDAIAELRELLRLHPGEIGALCLLAKTLRKLRRHEEEVVVARELVRLRPGDAGFRRSLSRSYFLWFDAMDQDHERARRILEEWSAFDPDDPVARHMRAARSAEADAPARASDAYVERHFDEFAATFDDVLRGLGYRGPELVREALELAQVSRDVRHDVADLGCGTGACGPILRPLSRRLTGVDLSPKMLERARTQGLYDELVHAEVTAFLEARKDAFGLVVCADTLPYIGDLAPLFGAAARALRPGGRFIATAEVHEGKSATFHLHEAGRYAHDPRYVTAQLERAGLAVERTAMAELRREFATPVQALVFTARRG